MLLKQISLNFVVLKKHLETQTKLKLNGTLIKQVHFAKFLGIYIDEHLTWDKHTQQVASKLL